MGVSPRSPRQGRAAGRVWPRLEALEDRALPTLVTGGFPALDFNASGGVEPPDTDIAVGPVYLVETVNTALAVYNKGTGAEVGSESLAQLFAPAGVPAGADLFDPCVGYDDTSGRFVIGVAEESDAAGTSYLDVAVSNDSDPTHGFSELHRIAAKESQGGKSFWGDFPRLGWNADALVFSLNMYAFPGATGAYDHVQLVVLNKASVLDANAATLTVTHIDRTDPADYTLVPAKMHGAAAGAPMWLVEENDGASTMRVVGMTNVLAAAPTFTDTVVSVPAYAQPVAPQQPGGAAITTVIDSSVLDVVWRAGTLAASQDVGAAGVTHARWYEFDVAGATPALAQSGDVDRGPGVYTFFPGIDLAPGGGLGVTFLESSPVEYMTMAVAVREAFEPADTLEPAVIAQAGEATYVGSRAGDFSGLVADPVDGSFWAGNEFANHESTNWGTWVAHFVASPVLIAAGADASGGPQVTVVDGYNGGIVRAFFAYTPTFAGGVRTAVGDVNGDGVPDVVTAPGAGMAPEVKVFDGATGALLRDFLAYAPTWTGGVFVAAGDINDDGIADLVIGKDAGAAPRVRVFSGKDVSLIQDFFAYAPSFPGGVRVAAGDVNGDGYADIITGAGPGGGPHVEVFSGKDLSPLQSFFAYSPYFPGGVYVAAGDTNGDGHADVITGAGPGGGPQVEVFSGINGALLKSFYAYGSSFTGGVRVGWLPDVNGDGGGEIVTGAGPGMAPEVKVIDGLTKSRLDDLFAFDQHFLGGVYVGG